MEDLTQKEKEKYDREMDHYIKILNDRVNPYKGILYIGEVGYGIPIEDNYFYFDYPYSSRVDELNAEVFTNDHLRKMLDNVFNAFLRHQISNENNSGYIYYKYTFNENQECFTLFELKTNIKEFKEDTINFLAIAHFNIYTNSNYHASVELSTELAPDEGVNQILYVVKYLEDYVEKKPSSNRHLLTLTMYVKKGEIFHPNYTVIDFVYNNWVKLLEVYFGSPIMEKVLLDSRKREILSYQHNIYNLRLPLEMGHLQEAINKTQNEVLKSKVFDLHRKHKILRLMLFFTFKTESFDSSGWEKFPLADINICDIIEYFSKELTHFKIKVHCNYNSDICKDRIPNRKYLSDITQVLWNLWTNAITQTLNTKENTFYINLSLISNDLEISIQNEGVIPIKYKDYINLQSARYPGEKKQDTQYRGLQIIKFICSKNGWSIQCKRRRALRKTIFLLTLSKNIWKS